MKKLFAFLISGTLFFGACNNPVKSENKPTETKTDSIPAKAVYACPIHPAITSDKPGQCSECGMDLEKK